MAVSFYAGTSKTSERKYHYPQPIGLRGQKNERTKDRTLEHPSDEEHILGNFRPFFLFAGLQILYAWPPQTGLAGVSFLGRHTTVFNFSMVAGICTEVFLLALRIILGMSYQEEVIETSLLDYVENRWREPAKIIPLENARSSNTRESRTQKKKEKEKEIQPPKDSRDKAMRQMEQGSWKLPPQTADTVIC